MKLSWKAVIINNIIVNYNKVNYNKGNIMKKILINVSYAFVKFKIYYFIVILRK